MTGHTSAFVGREAELGALRELEGRVARGQGPSAVVVVGDPGSGKSRLLAEMCAWTAVGHAYRIVGFEPARQVPLAAASEFLRALTLAPREGERLSSLLFDNSVATVGLQPLRIFEATHRALRALGPGVVVVDDLQWTDEQTLALCHYIMRAALTSQQALGLVIASRPSSVADSLLGALAQLLPQDKLASVALEPLSQREGVRLATALAPGLSLERAEVVWTTAQGSPFWIEALTRSRGTESDASQIVSARLSGLSAAAISLFAILTVAGRPLPLRDLILLLQGDSRQGDEAAAQLINRGIVVQRGTVLALEHDLIREAGLRQLPSQERQRIHRQLALWIETEAGDDVGLLALALEHRRGGGMPLRDLALRLAQSPSRGVLGSDGLRKLAAIADEAPPDAGGNLLLEQHVAALSLEFGEWSIALDRCGRLSELLPAESDRRRAAFGAATAAYKLRRADEAFIHLARCRDSDDPLLAIEADALEAVILGWHENRTAEGKAHAGRARAAAYRLIDQAGGIDGLTPQARRAVVAAFGAAADAAIWVDDIVDMLAVSDELIDAGRTMDDVPLAAALQAGYYGLFQLGRFHEAEVRFRHVLDEARRRVLPVNIAGASFALAAVLFTRAQFGQARTLAAEAVELCDRGVIPDRFTSTQVRSLLYRIAAAQGGWRRELARHADLFAAQPNPHHRVTSRMELARWLARYGGNDVSDEVGRELATALKDIEAARCQRCHGEFLLTAAEAYARTGRWKEGQDLAGQWDNGHPDPWPWYALLREQAGALLAAHSGDMQSALSLFEAARVRAEQLGAAREVLWLQLDVGEALAATDRPAAIATLQVAASDAERVGFESARERAAQMLRALGVRTWKRAGVPKDGSMPALSQREREVGRLVAEGASNPEIASAMFLSRKTVERHVSNILHKLGVRNRTELASAMRRFNEELVG